MTPYELLEHTADVGIRAVGKTLEETFEQATRGLLEITGASRPGDGDEIEIAVQTRDTAGALVDWLDEVLYLQDARDAVITDVRLDEVGDGRARGRVRIAPRGDEVLAGTAVKAVTYHQLRVDRAEEGWVAEVFVDV